MPPSYLKVMVGSLGRGVQGGWVDTAIALVSVLGHCKTDPVRIKDFCRDIGFCLQYEGCQKEELQVTDFRVALRDIVKRWNSGEI